MNDSFCNDFLANFLSDILVGVLFGTWLAWWVGKKLDKFSRSQQRKEEKRAELEKTIRYLDMLKNEIDPLLKQLPSYVNSPQPYVGPEKIRIPTPFWNVLQPSGELPRLINPELLASLTKFYDELMYAKQGWELLLDRLVNSDVTKTHSLSQDELENVIRVGIEQALKSGTDLSGKLDSEINKIESEIQKLQKQLDIS